MVQTWRLPLTLLVYGGFLLAIFGAIHLSNPGIRTAEG